MTSKIFALSLSLALCAGIGRAQVEPPKLVVVVLVDQLRYDYMERFHKQFSDGGFKLLTDHGAFMTFARYNYYPTITGPGHASFLSGGTPSMHGIIANDWFDKRTGQPVYCCADSSVEGVGTNAAEGKRSPRNFIGANFADEFRLRFQSKVVSLSMKDRGAIFPGGKKPTGAFWFEAATGNFISSTYYGKTLPDWVQKFNDRHRAAQFIGQKWTRLLDEKEYQWPDDQAGEGISEGEAKPMFDHTISESKAEGYESIMPTPYGNQILLELAEAAMEGEHLGTGPQPDLLCVSFSSVDYCGHKYGPYSQEMQDIVLRLDRQLEELFTYFGKAVGPQNFVLVLTADHGVAPTPEFAAAEGLDGQRVDPNPLMSDLVAKLDEKFGPGKYLMTLPNKRVPRVFEGNLYFNMPTLQEKQIQPETLVSFIREWALSTGKIQAVYGREQLLDGRAPGLLGERVLNGYNAERSGDVVLVFKPYIIPGAGNFGTTHGSPYAYDSHIPVFFYGSAFKPGRYADEFYITDIVPTLSAALHLQEPPGNMGKPFWKALVEEGPAK